MSPELIGLMGIIALFVLMFLNIPIGFVMMLVGTVGYGIIIGPTAAFGKLGTDLFNNAHNYGLSVIPMFTLMGMLLGHTGLGKDLFQGFNAWMGHIRGGLSIATIATCAAFAAVSGSVIATTATIANVAVPEMRAANYDDRLSSGCVASGSTLGILIPPSSVLIIYGLLTEESIGQLLVGGVLPGLMTAFLLAITCYILVIWKPELAPGTTRTTWKEKFSSIKLIWPVPTIFILSIGGMFAGIFTPTEGGAIGAFVALLVSIAGRRFTFKGFYEALLGTVKIVSMLMILLVGGVTFGNFLSVTKIPQFIITYFIDLPPLLLMTAIFACYFVAGFFMDAMAILVIFTPMFYPLIIKAGYSGIWYGEITILMLLIGFLTPPVGIVAIITSGITKIRLETVFKGVIPFWIALAVSTFLLIFFPQIATVLPSMMAK